MLTQEELKSCIEYDPVTGIFMWTKNKKGLFKGTVAGYKNAAGHWVICIDYNYYRADKLAFLYMTGEFPKERIIHINGSKLDLRWSNLEKFKKIRRINRRCNRVKKPITCEQLKNILTYDPDTGLFQWSEGIPPNFKYKVGSVAGYRQSSGYKYIELGHIRYPFHRLAWFYMTGEWPNSYIDHINRDPSDNRWSNLREASLSQNQANSSRPNTRNKTSKYKGVSRHSPNSYVAEITINRNRIRLGSFPTPEEAAKAYDKKAHELYGEYAYLNFPDEL